MSIFVERASLQILGYHIIQYESFAVQDDRHCKVQ